ncbi:hypothetical protein ACFWZ2_19650 [Streptomyces sp. NPDC059002]|uniref:hypothetical protein n=1 Tax=Streptomyces sp. NPDC059002 TaxID=3346690 RepID=UPI00368A2980
MFRKQALTSALSAALCGTLALVPAASAAPREPTPPPQASAPVLPPLPSLPSAPTTPQPWTWPGTSPSPTTEPTPKPSTPLTIKEDPRRDRERLAQSWRTIGKFGGASGSTADLAGIVLGGERDEKKLDVSVAEANKSLDNLLAIIPGGSLSRAKARGHDIRSTVELLKADNRAFKEAGVRGDVAAIFFQSAWAMVHLSLLAFDIFFGLGLSFAQAFLPFPLPDFKLPEFKMPEPPKPPAKKNHG